MPIDTFVAGRYSGTYNAVDVGITEQGYELQQDCQGEDIGETDAYGLSVIDFVYRGGNAFLQFDSKAYKAGSITPFWPWASVLGVLTSTTPTQPIGRLASNVALVMVLTATAGTPAATAPAAVTANLAILATNNPLRLLYNSKIRNVPVRLRLLPFTVDAGVTYKWFF